MIERSFACSTASVTAARAFALEAAERLGLTADLDVIELVACELAANCVRHAQTDFRMAVARSGDAIRISATDHGGGAPAIRHTAATVPSGRGLRIIDSLSRDWGVDRDGDETTVWLTLTLTTAPEDDPEPSTGATQGAERGSAAAGPPGRPRRTATADPGDAPRARALVGAGR